MRECPSCHAPWETNQRGGCLHCGWSKGGDATRPGSGHDGLCHYRYNNRRCPFPGNILDGGKWFCRHHVNDANRSQDLEQANFFRMFDPATDHGRACIVDMLAEWYGSGTKHAARDLAKKHPEWNRQPGEAASAYHARMFDLCRRRAPQHMIIPEAAE